MSDPTPSTEQLEDLTQAITRLLPVLVRLEDSLSSMDEEAHARQTQLAKTLDRIATALEALPENRKTLLEALSRQQNQSATLGQVIQMHVQDLQAERQARAALEARIGDLTRLLAGPA